jgi:hypothetical protein
MMKPLETSPELLALLEKTRGYVMTKEERAAQRKSWVIGNFMLDHPEVSREYAEAIYEKVC